MRQDRMVQEEAAADLIDSSCLLVHEGKPQKKPGTTGHRLDRHSTFHATDISHSSNEVFRNSDIQCAIRKTCNSKKEKNCQLQFQIHFGPKLRIFVSQMTRDEQ
jgi:hypothetical protein